MQRLQKRGKTSRLRTRKISKGAPDWQGTAGDVAIALNLSTRRIRQLAKEGLPRLDHGRYDIPGCLRFYVRYLQRKLVERALPEDGDGDAGGPATSSAAKRHEMLEIELQGKKLDLAERRERLISVEKFRRDMTALVTEIRKRFGALPPKLAAEILGETDPAIAQVKIDRSVKTVLESLSEFDPDEDPVAVP